MSTKMFSVADRLHAVLRLTGLSQSEFCKKLDISERTFKNYEKGITEISSVILKKIDSDFGVDIRWLLLGEGFIDTSTLGDVVEAAVIETQNFFIDHNLIVDPKKEAKVVRYLVEQIQEQGDLSEQEKQRFFKAAV